MFSLIRLMPAQDVKSACESDFDRDYPKESFDVDDPDNSPVESVLCYCCGMIHESGLFGFQLDFGDGERFDLPIKPELSILLAQFDQLVSLLRDDIGEAEVDFYEQGYEMAIQFSRFENCINVHAQSKVNRRMFQRQVSHEEMSKTVSRFLLEFLSAVGLLTPSILGEPAFEQWFRQMLLRPAS